MIKNIKLPETTTSQDAKIFAIAHTRKTLRGNSVGKNVVTIDNVTEDLKIWINEYIETNFKEG
jgi:hypothetical protein